MRLADLDVCISDLQSSFDESSLDILKLGLPALVIWRLDDSEVFLADLPPLELLSKSRRCLLRLGQDQNSRSPL
jgi:hypothetical protein